MPEAPAPVRARRLDHASILVVDDSDFDRARIVRHCRALGFALTMTGADTLAAMETALNKSRFDLVLLDFTLPDGDGVRGLEIIAASGRNRTTATIVITSREEPDVMEKAMQSGAVDFIRKSDLGRASLHRAALNALQKSGLMRDAQEKSRNRAALEAGFRAFGLSAARDMSATLTEMAFRLDRLENMEVTPDVAAECTLLRRACQTLGAQVHALGEPPGSIVEHTLTGQNAARIAAAALDDPNHAGRAAPRLFAQTHRHRPI